MATFYLGMATFFLGMATLFLGLATFFLGIIFFQNGYILVPHQFRPFQNSRFFDKMQFCKTKKSVQNF